MRTLRHAAALALALAAPAASAQLSNHAVAVESGVSSPAAEGGGALVSFALSASSWIGGEVEGIARVSFASAPATGGRAAASQVCGTAGLRVSLLPDPLRPQLQAEVGWARAAGGAHAGSGFAIAIGAGVEWFPARDLSVAARLALRGPPSALALEASFGGAAYF